MAFEAVCEGLLARGWAVVSDFLSPAETTALAAAAARSRDDFRPAGVGRGAEKQVNAEIRSDLIRWLDDGATAPDEIRAALAKLDHLKSELNRTLFLGLRDFEGHLAIYPPGARYQKHVDNFRDASPRALSCVLYLNDGWTQADAGQLRLYEITDPDRVATDIAPRAGTLAVFLSREIPHEVLPTTKERISFTGWFRDR